MTGFEPQISGVGSNRSTNWATTPAMRKESRYSCLTSLDVTKKENMWLLVWFEAVESKLGGQSFNDNTFPDSECSLWLIL